MNIGIDISSIPYNRGVSRYTSNLLRALTKQKNIKLNLYGSSLRQKQVLENFAKQNHFNEYIFQNYPPRLLLEKLWHLGLNPIKKQMPDIDLFHSWDWLQPPDKNLPLVSTIHDLAILKFPETAHSKILKMHQRAWKILKNREAEIIAVSKSTKDDLINLLNWDAKKIHVIYEALPQETIDISKNLSEEKYSEIKSNLLLNKPYLFFVGTREPRKNLVRLIKAWQPLAKDYDLLIAGESGWDKSERLTGVKPRFLGKVSDEELIVLYSEASLFCYPSLYEGFGLPILEAFHYGTPVLSSNISSMPEVTGNAAMLIDPKSIESINGGIKKILKESKKEQQKRLQKMIIRLHQFSWEKAARETIEVYKKAIS
ncbi:MAG: glycosyltransferase family 1 protein [Patescibacteria group bacterium]